MGDNKGKLVRELGFKEGLTIGLGTMIGAGIFVFPAIATERAGLIRLQLHTHIGATR